MTHGISRFAADVGKLVLTLVGAATVGGAIPAGWVVVGGLVQSATGGEGLAFVAILTIFAGILVTYYAIIYAAARIGAARSRAPGGRPRPGPENWNRAMSDERHVPPVLSMLETVFVWTAILATAAFLVWFLFFAGSPLPAAYP